MTGERNVAPPATLAWTIWGLGAALYFIGFYQRVAPAVITTELTQTFALTAAALGNLSAFYFYSYVAMQIPTGILADRYGPRVLLTVGGFIAALGTAVFAMATDVTWANMGRLLIGGSVGVAFVAMLKIASHWMPARQFAMTSGVALAVGVFGAVFAGAPLRLLVNEFGWRHVMWASAAVTVLVAIITWLVVRDDPAERNFKSYAPGKIAHAETNVLDGLKEVLRYRNVVLMFFIPGAASSIVLTFAGLWGVPFLTTHYGLTQTNAAGLCSTMLVSWAIGSLVFGAVSDRIGRRKSIYIGGLTIALCLWATLIYTPRIPYFWLVILNLIYVYFFTPSVPWAMLPIFIYAIGSALAMTSLTLSVLDMFPTRRGMAASLQGFISGIVNAVVAGVLSPMVSHSAMLLAIAMLALMTAGLLCWWGSKQLSSNSKLVG